MKSEILKVKSENLKVKSSLLNLTFWDMEDKEKTVFWAKDAFVGLVFVLNLIGDWVPAALRLGECRWWFCGVICTDEDRYLLQSHII